MAHGWNSYYHNLPPMSSDPGASKRTSDAEGTLPNYIGQEFSNPVASHDHITNSNYCTDYYPNTGVANSNSDCVYQRYSSDTRWQADQQTGKGYMQRCAKSDMPDFATGGLHPSEFKGLDFKQQCGLADASFHENYSDVSSGSDETKPSCDYEASNLLRRSKMDLPPENTSSDWISAHTGSMTYPTESAAGLETDSVMPSGKNVAWTHKKIDSRGSNVESPTENGQSVTTSYMTATKFDTALVQNDNDLKPEKTINYFYEEKCSDISRSKNGNVLGDEIHACADDNGGTMTPPTDEKDLSGQKVMQEKINSENKEVKHLTNKADKTNLSNEEEPNSEVLVKERCIKGFLKEISDSHPSYENMVSPSEGNLLTNICGIDTDPPQHESSVDGMAIDNISPDSSDNCEIVSKEIPASENQGLSNCLKSSSPLPNLNTNDNPLPGKELACEEQKTEATNSDGSEPSFTNDSPAKDTAGIDTGQETKMTISSEQNTTTSSTDENNCCSNLPESCLQPVTLDSNEIGISTAPERANPEPEPDDITSSVMGEDSAPSAFRSLETGLQLITSCTDVHSCSDMEWTEQGLNSNARPLTDQQDLPSEKPEPKETPCPSEDVAENAQESFKDMKVSTEEPSVSDGIYGEPLSREDSSCDPDETAPDASQNNDGDNHNGKFHSECHVPRPKVSAQLKTFLHPVVILKEMESTVGRSHFYRCAECAHATSNVDGLIAHHHCAHTMVNVQSCKTCHLYQIGNEQAKKHVCGVIDKQMEISADDGQQKKPKLGRHKCNICSKRFVRIISYNQHMRTHTGKTPFRCNGCGLYFSQSCSLNRHKRVPGRCKQSNLSETNSDAVGNKNQMPSQKDAVENDHSANIQECYVKLIDIARTTQCYICGKKYPSVAKANKHRYAVHNIKSVPMLLKHFVVKTKSDTSKKYKCPLCPRLFKYSYNRARHLRDCVRNATYNGKGKVNGYFQCPLCYTTFSLPHNRYRHIKKICLRECLSRLALGKPDPIKQESDNKPKVLVQDSKPKTQPEENERKKRTPSNSTALTEPRYKCGLCPAIFHHPSGKYKHKKKHELYKVSGKIIRYRKSIFSVTPKPTVSSSKKTEEKKDNLISTEETGPVTLKCHFCDKCFGTSRSLTKHKRRHRGEKPFHCLECGRRFKKRCYLVGHRSIHQKRIQCTLCRKILPSIGELIQHRKIQHPNKRLIKCPECPQEFQYPVYLRRHFTVHQNKENKPSQLDEMQSVKPEQSMEMKEQTKSKLQCSLCKEEFDDAQTFRKHALTHISASSSNQCPFCERSFSCRQYLLRHMLQHTGNKAYSCTNCGKQFYRLMFLKLHCEKCLPATNQLGETKPTKTKRPYVCSHCPRSFSKKMRLKNHLIAHKKNTLQLCSNCGGHYGINRVALHLKECTRPTKNDGGSSLPPVKISMKCTSSKVKDEDEISQQSKTSKLLPLKCPHCPKRFKFKSIQLRHLVSHTGVQPYACVHCGKRFGSQNMCTLHENLCGGISKAGLLKPKTDAVKTQPNMPPVEKTADHSQADGEAAYKCKFCTKTFMKPRSLRRHILTHNEVKPYRCKACDGCFSRHDHLKVHQARCKSRKRRLEVCIPKISLNDVGKGWQIKFGNDASEKKDTFDCEFCTRAFSTQSKLSRHVTMFHSAKLFKCSRCSSAFSHEKSLKKHRKRNKCRRPPMQGSAVPSDGTDPAAENGTGGLDRISRVLKRIQPSTNKKYKFGCSFCPRVFTNGSHLAVHIRLHTGERPYSCNYCGQKFVRKDYVQRHYQKCTLKRQQNNVLCDRCGSFFPANQLENHKTGCTATSDSSASMAKRTRQSTPDSPPKGFSCAYCSKRFLLFSQLQEHFLASHKVETMEPLGSTAPLQQHLSNMPSNKETADESCDEGPNDDAFSASKPSSPLKSKVPEKFFCFECNTSFANKAGLAGHQRTHQNVNPITCKICNKTFGNKLLLRNHYRKCKKTYIATKESESPLKATLDFAVNDSVLVFKEKSETTGSGVLQTNFSCKDSLSDQSSRDSERSQEPSSSSKEKKEVQYQCSECDRTFTDGLLLISHLEDHGRKEQEKKRNTCTRCGRVCSNQANLEKHMKMHGISKKFPCLQCSKMFFTMADLEDHKTCHDPNRPYFCKLCFQRFWTRPSLCNHYSEEHVDDAFTCQFCSKTYASKKSLVRHYKRWHPNEQKECKSTDHEKGNDPQNPNSKVSTSGESDKEENSDEDGSDSDLAPYFPCHVCGKTFTTSENLEDHQLCHLGKKPHECAECGKCFFQASQLQQHRRSHQSEFQCPTCGKGFVSRFALRRHKQSHVKIHPYPCSRCHLTFKCQAQLTEHMYTHREDNFPCDICNEVFVSKSSRAEHRKSHTFFQDHPLPPVSRAEQEQPNQVSESSLGYSTELKYRCGVCHDRFRDPEELSEHGCLVSKERPHSCTDCEKYFLHASHLKKHRNTHLPSGSDTEYPCKQCNTTFYSTKDFLGHLNNPDDMVVEIKRESDDEGEGPIPTFICPVCHKCFPSGIELIYHFPTHPDGAYKCEKRVPPENSVKAHGGSSQTPAVAVKCKDCGQSFSGDDAFHQHNCSSQRQAVAQTSFTKLSSDTYYRGDEEEDVDVTKEELYNCPACSKKFTSKSCLLEHQNMDHSDGKPFRCEICGKSFAKKRYLKKHQFIHRENVAVSHTPQSKKRVLNCPRCNASFSTKQDLSQHMRLHAQNEVGEYRCDMCYKSFSLWSLLRQHQESHVGEVVYECTECDKAFAFPHLLEEHQQTHAGSSR